jgi:hypothetical protein
VTVARANTTSRNGSLENSVGAGLLGIGYGPPRGVWDTPERHFGYEQATSSDLAFESAQKAGVVGRGEIGVSGDGANGPGVFSYGLPGVLGQSTGGAAVLAEGQTGVYATGTAGDGLHATFNHRTWARAGM